MATFHDETTGKWFNYNSDCASCWLGHSHTFDRHLDMLSDFLAVREMNMTIWIVKGNNDLYQEYKALKAKHLTTLKKTIQLYDKFSY